MTSGHTFASWLIQQGESLPYVRDQLGHKSIAITVDVYGHLVPGGNRAAVDRLDDAQPNATPAQPAALVAEGSQPVSALDAVVSRVGIAPERRGRRPKPECLRITRRNHVERGETW
jgi:hypothetical protein